MYKIIFIQLPTLFISSCTFYVGCQKQSVSNKILFFVQNSLRNTINLAFNKSILFNHLKKEFIQIYYIKKDNLLIINITCTWVSTISG